MVCSDYKKYCVAFKKKKKTGGQGKGLKWHVSVRDHKLVIQMWKSLNTFNKVYF